MIKSTEIEQFFKTEKVKLQELYPDVTVDTLKFIMDSLASAGLEKRVNSTHKKVTVRGSVEHKVGDVVE